MLEIWCTIIGLYLQESVWEFMKYSLVLVPSSQPNEQDPAVKRRINKSLLDKNNTIISTSAE